MELLSKQSNTTFDWPISNHMLVKAIVIKKRYFKIILHLYLSIKAKDSVKLLGLTTDNNKSTL